MKIFAETERLILREIVADDEDAFFEMDSDPEVHKYLGNNPVKSIEEIRNVIQFVRQQYLENGIGRWAVIEKSSGNFIGWSGLKFISEEINKHTNFYDIGYRLNQKYWGKGYATESAKAALRYGFVQMNLEKIFGTAHVKNIKSRKALEKSGLTFVKKFVKNNLQCDWFEITREDWEKQNG